MAGALRQATNIVVADGQSLNNLPAGDTWIIQLQADHLPDVTIWNCSVDGYPFDSLEADNLAARRNQFATAATNSILVLIGGQSDIIFGDTAATIYADMVTYAESATAAGFDAVIATTIVPSTFYSAGQNTIRLAANTLISADGDGAFTTVVDLANTAGLDTVPGASYADGLHWSATGAAEAAAALAAPITALLV